MSEQNDTPATPSQPEPTPADIAPMELAGILQQNPAVKIADCEKYPYAAIMTCMIIRRDPESQDAAYQFPQFLIIGGESPDQLQMKVNQMISNEFMAFRNAGG